MDVVEMETIHHDAHNIYIGASATISNIEKYLITLKKDLKGIERCFTICTHLPYLRLILFFGLILDFQTPIVEALLEMTERFAGKQIKNVAVIDRYKV